MEFGDIATWLGVIATLGISIAAYRDSRKQAEIAREANEANHTQAEAAERRAQAVEDSLASALRLLAERAPGVPLPTPPPAEPVGDVAWTLQRRGKHGYLLRNLGNSTATGVRIDPNGLTPIVRNVPENATVRPGESVQFLMAPTLGHPLPGEIWIEWEGAPQPLAIPIPG